jgi:hypothetical protein
LVSSSRDGELEHPTSGNVKVNRTRDAHFLDILLRALSDDGGDFRQIHRIALKEGESLDIFLRPYDVRSSDAFKASFSVFNERFLNSCATPIKLRVVSPGLPGVKIPNYPSNKEGNHHQTQIKEE